MPPCVVCTDPSRRRPEHREVDPFTTTASTRPRSRVRARHGETFLLATGRPRRSHRLLYRRSTHAGRCQEVVPTRDVVGDALVKVVYASNRLDSWFCRAFVSRSGRGPRRSRRTRFSSRKWGRPDVLGGNPFQRPIRLASPAFRALRCPADFSSAATS